MSVEVLNMKSESKTPNSTKLLLPQPPQVNSTIFGIDFDPSGYSRKVELLNEGSGINSHTPRKKSGIEVRRKVTS